MSDDTLDSSFNDSCGGACSVTLTDELFAENAGLKAEWNMLRSALVDLVGTDKVVELKALEVLLQSEGSVVADVSDEDRDASLNAVRALIETAGKIETSSETEGSEA